MKRIPLFALLLLLGGSVVALGDQEATYHGASSTAERAFVAQIAEYLMAHYPVVADAEQNGYVRYTGEDETGAISYADQAWQSEDVRHPSQLWYDKNGRLLGADYSVLLSTSPSRPNLWGVNPGRWVEFDGHVHWVSRDPSTGINSYDHWTTDKAFAAAGGDPGHPDAATLVVMKKVASANQVVTIFHFPSLWDLIVWVKPNPNGAFALKNPAVKP